MLNLTVAIAAVLLLAPQLGRLDNRESITYFIDDSKSGVSTKW